MLPLLAEDLQCLLLGFENANDFVWRFTDKDLGSERRFLKIKPSLDCVLIHGRRPEGGEVIVGPRRGSTGGCLRAADHGGEALNSKQEEGGL